MKTSLLFTAALALVLAGCNKSTRSSNTAASDTAATSATPTTDYAATHADTAGNGTINTSADRISNDVRNAANSASSAIGSAATNVATTARMTEWKLNASDIQADLDNNREIVRSKESTAGAPTGSADKSVVESMVKSRLEADNDIAPLKLKVSADKHGDVTLKGKAHSAEEVGRAVALALDTEGVAKVTSKVKLDKDAKTTR